MASIPYALSITHFVNSVGAKAGFASIIGLALLVLLFFTQSRETANLRRRADEAEQQLYQLQLYVDHLSRQRTQHAAAPASPQTTSAPVAAPPAAALALAGASRAIPGEQAAPASGGVATLIPAAPAGVGAPALSSATRLIPLADPDEISIRALHPSTNGDGEGRPGAVSDATVATPPPAPPPSTAAGGGGNGVARPPVPVPMPSIAPAPEPAPPPRVALPRQQQRPPGRPPMGPPPPRRGGQGSSGRRISPVFFVLAGVLVIAVVAVVLIFVTGSSNSNSSSSSTAASANSASSSQTNAAKGGKNGRQRKAATTTVTPSNVTVQVLNGTATDNLAHDVADKLTTAGYKATGTQNASETGLTSTIVGYTASSARTDALAVAKSLNLGPASVQAVSQGDRLKVCGSTTTCTTQVIVTAGADLAQTG
jgi:LytR cell envelope-related transcriptional attenuator